MSASPSAAEVARTTLLRLSELGLPPTPENYARIYADVSGAPKPEPTAAERAAHKIIRMTQELVNSLSEDASQLASELGEKNIEVRHTIDRLSGTREKELIMQLVELIVTKADAMHDTVEDTHKNFEATQRVLAHMSVEIAETRQALLEDPLTGAQNRRGMDAILSREVARSKRNGNRLSIAMIDVDHFKRVNDTYGHDAGDKLLVHLALLARSVLREPDTLVRYGGEEFLLILPEADAQGAGFVMERLRQVIAKSPFMYEQKKIQVTVSAGLAQLADAENGHSLLLRADKALYEAKQAGRNCVRVSSDGADPG
jgi:diguanylate cyclase